jgi:hypothetical protein
MSKDFRVVEASWSPALAAGRLELSRAAFVLVRRREGDAVMYFVYSRKDVLNWLDGSSAVDLGEALSLHEDAATPTVSPNTRVDPVDRSLVVVSAQGALGVIVPARRMRGTPGTRESDPRFAMVDRPEPSAPGEPLPRRLTARLPSTIATGATVTMTVSLAAASHHGATAVSLAKPAGTKIEVLVEPLEGLTIVGPNEGVINVAEPQQEPPLIFKVKGGDVGAGSLRVLAICDGACIAAFPVTTSIVAVQAAGESDGIVETARVDVRSRQLPDLALFITELNGSLTFRLLSADGSFHMKPFGPTNLRSNAQDYFRGMFKDIENLPVETPEQRRDAQDRLGRKGQSLFDAAFPADLKVLLWDMRDRIATVQITSDEPWIPWEFCRLKGKTEGRVVDGKFFGEAFAVTRWLYGTGPPRRITLDNIALVVPGDSQLKQAGEEEKYIMSLGRDKRRVQNVKATYDEVIRAMEKGEHDGWHFTGHAHAGRAADASQAAIELMERDELKAEDVIGEVENLLLPRPFIFLNACQTAQGGLSLTGVGGWARRFIQPATSDQTASAFIGTYWAVDDGAAFEFAKALYQGILGGKQIGQAARDARLTIRQQDDPTWLAYTVYADPQATVR